MYNPIFKLNVELFDPGLQVKVKEDKHRKELMLLSVDRTHAEYQAYHPVKRAQTAEGAAQPAASTSEADGQQLEVSIDPTFARNPVVWPLRRELWRQKLFWCECWA